MSNILIILDMLMNFVQFSLIKWYEPQGSASAEQLQRSRKPWTRIPEQAPGN